MLLLPIPTLSCYLAITTVLHQSPHSQCLCKICLYSSLFLPARQEAGGSVPYASTLLEGFWDLPSLTEESPQFYRSPESSILGCVWIQWDLSSQNTKVFPNDHVHLKRSWLLTELLHSNLKSCFQNCNYVPQHMVNSKTNIQCQSLPLMSWHEVPSHMELAFSTGLELIENTAGDFISHEKYTICFQILFFF